MTRDFTMRLDDREDLFKEAKYQVNIDLRRLPEYIASGCGCGDPSMVDVDPDYQRGHVWTISQKRAFIEYFLRGGESAKDIIFACDADGPYSQKWRLLDGKQRVAAAIEFMSNKFGVFPDKDHPEGHLASQIDGMRPMRHTFRIRVIVAASRAEELQIYLNLNSGGTPHSREEIERVKSMLDDENKKGA